MCHRHCPHLEPSGTLAVMKLELGRPVLLPWVLDMLVPLPQESGSALLVQETLVLLPLELDCEEMLQGWKEVQDKSGLLLDCAWVVRDSPVLPPWGYVWVVLGSAPVPWMMGDAAQPRADHVLAEDG